MSTAVSVNKLHHEILGATAREINVRTFGIIFSSCGKSFTHKNLTWCSLALFNNACVSPDELMEVALDLAREIAQKSPVAIKLAKQGLNQIEEMSLRDGYRFEQNMTAEVRKSADSKEAMQAFIEKRKPIFTGK